MKKDRFDTDLAYKLHQIGRTQYDKDGPSWRQVKSLFEEVDRRLKRIEQELQIREEDHD